MSTEENKTPPMDSGKELKEKAIDKIIKVTDKPIVFWPIAIISIVLSGFAAYYFYKRVPANRSAIELIVSIVIPIMDFMFFIVNLVSMFASKKNRLIKLGAACIILLIGLFIFINTCFPKKHLADGLVNLQLPEAIEPYTPVEMYEQGGDTPPDIQDVMIYPQELEYPPEVVETGHEPPDANAILIILDSSKDFFDFCDRSGILNNSEKYPTEKYANMDDVWNITTEKYSELFGVPNEDYEKLMENYFTPISLNQVPMIGIDRAIKDYENIAKDTENAKEWMLDDADGVTPNVLALLARDYKEIADLYIAKNPKFDNEEDMDKALNYYTKAIAEYAHLYRFCKRENLQSLNDRYQPLYWIATIYHRLGDIQSAKQHQTYLLSSFSVADSFFQGEQGSVDKMADLYLKAHSRYYSAMSYHKIYLELIKRYPKEPELLEEILQCIRQAKENYHLAYESGYLSTDPNKNEVAIAKKAYDELSKAEENINRQKPK